MRRRAPALHEDGALLVAHTTSGRLCCSWCNVRLVIASPEEIVELRIALFSLDDHRRFALVVWEVKTTCQLICCLLRCFAVDEKAKTWERPRPPLTQAGPYTCVCSRNPPIYDAARLLSHTEKVRFTFPTRIGSFQSVSLRLA